MARSFNGTSDKIQRGAAVVASAPFTLACWAFSSAVTSRAMVSLGNGSVNRQHKIYVNSAGNVVAESFDGATAGSSGSAGAWPSNAWSHVAGVWSATNSRVAYLNGSAGSVGSTNLNPTINILTIGAMSSGGIGDTQFWSGSLAEVGVWAAALSAEEIASLSKGASPALIRPQSLVFHTPLVRDIKEIRNGVFLSVSGTSVSDHPRIILP